MAEQALQTMHWTWYATPHWQQQPCGHWQFLNDGEEPRECFWCDEAEREKAIARSRGRLFY